MSALTLLTSSNVDAITNFKNGDTLTINNGATLTVNTNQVKFWTTITITQGTLLIQNTSSTQGIRFPMGQLSGSGADNNINMTNLLGNVIITGSWIYIGTGSGTQQTISSSLAFQSPPSCSGRYDYIPAVFVESSSGSGIYQPWFNCTNTYGQMLQYLRESTASLTPEPKKSNWFRQPAYNESQLTPLTASISGHFYPDLIFGETGNVIPQGCNVRIPNILITCDSNTNGDGSSFRNIFNFTSGTAIYNTCIFTSAKYLACTPVNMSITNVISLHPILVTLCYNLTIDTLAQHWGVTRKFFTPATNVWGTTDGRMTTFTLSAVSNARLSNIWCLGQFILQNSSNVTLNNFTYYGTFRNLGGNTFGLTAINLNDCILTNIKTYGGSISIGSGNNNLMIDGVEFGFGQSNEVSGTSTNGSIGWLLASSPRIGYVPARRERFQNNVPYYFKIRTYRNFYDLNDFTDNPVTYSATPYQGRMDLADESDAHPYHFGAALSMVTSSWIACLRWENPTTALQGNHGFTKYQIFKSTASIIDSGSSATGSQLVPDIVVAATNTQLDNQLTTGSTYYYTLRYYRNATQFTDSAQQVVIVPNFIPTTGSAYYFPFNMLLQSCTLATAPWANSGSLFAPTTTTTAVRAPVDTQNLGIASSRGTTIAFAAGGDGGRTQTVTVLSGSTYTLSAYMIGLAGVSVSGSAVLLSAITTTTSSVTCNLNEVWQRFSVTHSAGSTSLIFQITSTPSTRGDTIGVSLCQLETGSIASPPAITVAAALAQVGFVEMLTTTTTCCIGALSRGGRKLIELGWNLPANAAWHEIYCETSSNFTPSLANCAFSCQSDNLGNPVHFSGICNNTEIKNINSYGSNPIAMSLTANTLSGGVLNIGNVQPTNIMVRNVNINGGFVLGFILAAFQNSWNNVIVHNVKVTDARGFGSRMASTINVAANATVQNAITDAPEAVDVDPGASQICSNLIFKGNSMLWSGLNYTGSINSSSIANGIGRGVSTSIFGAGDGITFPAFPFDRIFGEAFTSGSEGLQYLLFTPSVQSLLPYVISGSSIIFDNTGRLYFGTPDETITYTWPWRIFGITGFQNVSGSVSQTFLGGNQNNGVGFGLLKEYALSNDGITYNTFKEMTPGNLTGESSSINPTNGFFMKIRLTPKQFMRFSTKATPFVIGETIINSSSVSAFTGSAQVVRIEDYGTTGSIWVSNVSGSWNYLSNIYSSGGVLRAASAGDAVFGAFYPQVVNSFVNGIAWPTVTDSTKLYPASYSNIRVTNVVSSSFVSIYDFDSGSWLESNQDGTSVTVQTPWNGNFTADIKVRKAGYRFTDLTQAFTRFGGTINSTAQTPLIKTPAINPVSSSILFTDHGTSSFVYLGKNYRYTIQIFDTSSILQSTTASAQNVASWFSWNTATDLLLTGSSYRGTAFPEFILENGVTSYTTQIGSISGVSGSAGGLIVLDSASNALYGFSSQQSNNGTSFTYPSFLTIQNSNIISGSRVRLFNSSSQVELENRFLTGSGYIYQTFDGININIGDTLNLRATYTNGTTAYLPLEMIGNTGTNGITFIDSQITDTVYNDNAIDGSTVTEFIADIPNIQVDLNDPDGITSVQRLYNWMEYIQTTSGGIASLFDSITAIDSVNYRIESSVTNLLLENVNPVLPIKIVGAYLFRADGLTVIYSGSYSIQMDPSKAYVASAGSLAAGVWADPHAVKVINNTTLIPALL